MEELTEEQEKAQFNELLVQFYQNREKRFAADCIMKFVDDIISTFVMGLSDMKIYDLSQIHTLAQLHVRQTYRMNLPDLSEKWGIDIANSCRTNSEPVKAIYQ